jgi:hypothetical protein
MISRYDSINLAVHWMSLKAEFTVNVLNGWGWKISSPCHSLTLCDATWIRLSVWSIFEQCERKIGIIPMEQFQSESTNAFPCVQ